MDFMAMASSMWTVAKSARPGRRLPGLVNMQKSLTVKEHKANALSISREQH